MQNSVNDWAAYSRGLIYEGIIQGTYCKNCSVEQQILFGKDCAEFKQNHTFQSSWVIESSSKQLEKIVQILNKTMHFKAVGWHHTIF